MTDDGSVWFWQGGAARNVVLFAAAYAIATAATILILIVILAALPVSYFRDGAKVEPRRSNGAVNLMTRLTRSALGVVLIAVGFVLSLPLVPGAGSAHHAHRSDPGGLPGKTSPRARSWRARTCSRR